MQVSSYGRYGHIAYHRLRTLLYSEAHPLFNMAVADRWITRSRVHPVVGEIKVSSVSLMKPKDGPEWYQAIFWATLPNAKKAICKTTKQIWAGRQCNVITANLRQKILEKAAEAGGEQE